MQWNEFDREVRELAKLIDYTPDMLIGIARGGVIPAVLLSKALKVKDFNILKMERVGEGRRITSDVIDVAGKKILLVEDTLETGRALKAGKEYLEERGAKVKTACLYTMPISEIAPDFSLREVPEVVQFPWQ